MDDTLDSILDSISAGISAFRESREDEQTSTVRAGGKGSGLLLIVGLVALYFILE